MNAEDRKLIDEVLQGNTAAFGFLVRRYQDRLYNAIYRVVDHEEDAQDVVQEAFLNAYQSLCSFKGDSEFYTWLYRIAFNSAISLRRRRKQVVHLDGVSEEEHFYLAHNPTEDESPSASMERQEQERLLHAALKKLSTEHRMVLILKDFEGKKYEDIAAILDVPIGTIRSRLHRARMDLRTLLQDDMEEPGS